MVVKTLKREKRRGKKHYKICIRSKNKRKKINIVQEEEKKRGV